MQMDRNYVLEILARLRLVFPNSATELKFSTPFELLVATILAAQCTDERVNSVTRSLFTELKTPADYITVELSVLEEKIRPTGFYKNKARAIRECSKKLVENFHGTVPANRDDLVSLPGVGRKTANLILAHAFHHPAIPVDTHVRRVAQRLNLSQNDDPDKIEMDLMQVFARENWIEASGLLVLHGRYTCQAKKPRCSTCTIADFCSWAGKINPI